MNKTYRNQVYLFLTVALFNYQCERKWVNPYDSFTEAEIEINNISFETLSPDSVRIWWDIDYNKLEGVILDKQTNNDPWLTEYATVKGVYSYIDVNLDVKTNTYAYRLYAFAGLNKFKPTTVVYNFVCGYDSVTDPRDGNVYSTIQIDKQCWFKENLSYLPKVFPSTETSVVNPRYYVYGYQGTDINNAMATENYNSYGVLYNWQAFNNACPQSIGWKTSTLIDWYLLINQAGDYDMAGNVLKDEGSMYWDSSNIAATNSFGFTALPGGMLDANSGFVDINYWAYFLSSIEEPQLPDPTEGKIFGMQAQNGSIQERVIHNKNAYSIRCIKQ